MYYIHIYIGVTCLIIHIYMHNVSVAPCLLPPKSFFPVFFVDTGGLEKLLPHKIQYFAVEVTWTLNRV